MRKRRTLVQIQRTISNSNNLIQWKDRPCGGLSEIRPGALIKLDSRFSASCAPKHTHHATASVVAGNHLARAQALRSILGPPLHLGDLGKFYVDLLIRDAVEQMPDQV
jgi:hypothetical protein